jgi:hypothetical protein
MNCGIYAIVCDNTWRSYVGQAVNIKKRTQGHFQLLRKNEHKNQSLQNDYNLYGEQSFNVEIIEIVEDKNKLIEREKYWQNFTINSYSSNCNYFSESPILSEKQIVYFWSLVDIKSIDDCWIWNGTVSYSGYGRIKFKKQYMAHRISYFLNNPEIDNNIVVRHKCNNRKCVNPNHLISGTIQENNLDIFLSGSKGILNWDDVKLIREKFKENPNITGRDMENWYFENIRPIKFDREYLIDVAKNLKWIDNNYIPPPRKMRKINMDIANEIRNLHKSGISYGKINKILDEKYNITLCQTTISNIIHNKLYKESI